MLPSASLSIFGGGEILSKEGVTQGDTTLIGVMPLTSLLDFVLTNELQTKEVAFGDGLKAAGKLADIKNFWDKVAVFVN